MFLYAIQKLAGLSRAICGYILSYPVLRNFWLPISADPPQTIETSYAFSNDRPNYFASYAAIPGSFMNYPG